MEIYTDFALRFAALANKGQQSGTRFVELSDCLLDSQLFDALRLLVQFWQFVDVDLERRGECLSQIVELGRDLDLFEQQRGQLIEGRCLTLEV